MGFFDSITDGLSSVFGGSGSSGGFLDGLGDTLTNSDFLSSALGAATSLASNLYQQKGVKEANDKDRQYELEKLKLQAQFGLLGNRGGGGGGSNRNALLYKAYQDYINNQGQARQGVSDALVNLGNAATRPVLR